MFQPGAPLLALFLRPCVRICNVVRSSSTAVIIQYTTGKSTLKDARLRCAVKCVRNDSTGTSTRLTRSLLNFTLQIGLPSLVEFAVNYSWIAPSTTNTIVSYTQRRNRISARYVLSDSLNKAAYNNTCECTRASAHLFAHFAQKRLHKRLDWTNISAHTLRLSRSSVSYAASVSLNRYIFDNICVLTPISNLLSVLSVGEDSSKAVI